jgi:hypothetical protein
MSWGFSGFFSGSTMAIGQSAEINCFLNNAIKYFLPYKKDGFSGLIRLTEITKYLLQKHDIFDTMEY